MKTNDIIAIAGGLVGSVFRLLAKSNYDAISSHVDELLEDVAPSSNSNTTPGSNTGTL